jgi:hypothetical protein
MSRCRSVSGLAVVGLSLWTAAAQGFDIEKSETRYANRRYQCELRIRLDAPLDRVEAVLRDYEHYPALDTHILQSRVLGRPSPNVAMLQTTLRACFGPFCRNVTRVERVEELPHELAAHADPARSDVKFGETVTRLSAAEQGGTLVRYRTSITPGFWIPSIVGRRWMLNTLKSATGDLFMNVEMRANESATQAGGHTPSVTLPRRAGEGTGNAQD